MKKYIAPASLEFSMEAEGRILAGSDVLNSYNNVVNGSGEGIGEQFTEKQDLWGNNSWE